MPFFCYINRDMTIRERIKELEERRKGLKVELSAILDVMAIVTVTRSYHSCGNPNCKKCKEGERHGPFLYMTWKNEEKKTRAFYVNRGLEGLADEAHEGWEKFKEVGRKIGEINREILKLKIREERKGRKNDRKGR